MRGILKKLGWGFSTSMVGLFATSGLISAVVAIADIATIESPWLAIFTFIAALVVTAVSILVFILIGGVQAESQMWELRYNELTKKLKENDIEI